MRVGLRYDDKVEKEDNKLLLTLPTMEDMLGDRNNLSLNILEKYPIYDLTDLAKMTYSLITEYHCYPFWTSSINKENEINCIDIKGNQINCKATSNFPIIRPILKMNKSLFEEIFFRYGHFSDNIFVVNFGLYPQYVPSKIMQMKLNMAKARNKLSLTNYSYMIGDTIYDVYMDDKKNKYICCYYFDETKASGKDKWVEITDVYWYPDEETNTLISCSGLLSGIPFYKGKNFNGKYETSNMYGFLNHYMILDLLQFEKIDYEIMREETPIEIQEEKKEEPKIPNSNESSLMSEIEYNLTRLKDINNELYLKFQKEYEEYLENNIKDITTLGYLNARIIAEISSNKDRPIDLLEYLKRMKKEYLKNFLKNKDKITQLDLNKLDKINEKFLIVQDKYNSLDKREVIKNLSMIYLLEVYENRNNIKVEELENSYFKTHLMDIIMNIKVLQELGIIECNYFLSLEKDITVKIVYEMIKNIEFNKNDNVEEVIRSL